MKRIVIMISVVFITTFLLATIPAEAQKRNVGTKAKNLFYGPKIGLNIASLSETDEQSRMGFCIGVFGEYKMRKDLRNYFILNKVPKIK